MKKQELRRDAFRENVVKFVQYFQKGLNKPLLRMIIINPNMYNPRIEIQCIAYDLG